MTTSNAGLSRSFDNAAFGYWKVTVERPLRIAGADPNRVYRAAETKELKENGKRSEDAPPIIWKIHQRGTEADPLLGRFAARVDGRAAVVEYEPDAELRDTEQIPLQEEGGIEAFLRREVLPYAADAWYRPDGVKIGYEISFTRYFYKPKPMRALAEIRADILALESETEGLLDDLLAREPRAAYGKLRVYADTSVIDEEIKDLSWPELRQWLDSQRPTDPHLAALWEGQASRGPKGRSFLELTDFRHSGVERVVTETIRQELRLVARRRTVQQRELARAPRAERSARHFARRHRDTPNLGRSGRAGRVIRLHFVREEAIAV